MKKYFIELISQPLSTYPCERILISPGVTIITQCDKRVCTARMVQYACTFGILNENALGAHDMHHVRGHYEKSLCSIMPTRIK